MPNEGAGERRSPTAEPRIRCAAAERGAPARRIAQWRARTGIAASLALAGCIGGAGPAEREPSVALPSCPAPACFVEPSATRGFSGAAALGEDSLLVAHDVRTSAAEAREPRLGIVTLAAEGFRYRSVRVGARAWQNDDPRMLANDLESVCALVNHPQEFLVAESGRVDERTADGVLVRNEHQGRIFHVSVSLGGEAPSARVTAAPQVRLPAITAPVLEPGAAPADAHSRENYEGMACAPVGADRYVVIAADRGDDPVLDTATLFWGLYDTSVAPAERRIEWRSAPRLSRIVAPGRRNLADVEWRDVTGLHIDRDGRIFATAAYDHDGDLPPFRSVLYQLGVLCVTPGDRHGATDACDYSDVPSPALTRPFRTLAETDHHKLESVAAAIGPGRVGLLAEDEGAGGAWWPSVSFGPGPR